jgi:hypothetical protein
VRFVLESTFPQTGALLLLVFVQEHIGLCAPRMPNPRPYNAVNSHKTRPYFAVENCFF